MDPRDRESIQNLLSGPFHLDGECKVRWGQKTLSVNVAPVRISGGELIGQVAVFHDITREAEVDRMKNNFLAMVSHELRTPLTSILGYAGMLKEGNYGGLADDQAKIVDRVIANTHKLLTLVNELLDQAQIETGRLSFHRRPFQPQELIEYTRGVMEGTIVSKNLELVTHYSEDLPGTLYGDPQRLSQVLVNLVNNAVKFTEQGRSQVVLSLAAPAHWCMEVSDTGVGIPQDAQQLIFDPFRQGDAEVTKRPGGIGLGLSIAKQLVQLMHGEIIVKSQVGSGSTFTVLLPLEIPETEQAIHE
jgi:signal transduction histidine kinase